MAKELIKNKFFDKKGVSPVIATILLVALVIIIGIIIFLWFQSLTQEAITKFGGQNIDLVCDDVRFDATYSGGSLIIENTGSVPIYNFNVRIEKSGGEYETQEISSLDGWPENKGMNQGDLVSITRDFGNDAESLQLIPILLGKNQDGETKSSACEERHGESVIL